MFAEDTLAALEALGKNDILKLTIEVKSEDGNNKLQTNIPVNNYHRAKNWAYSIQ